MQTNSKIFKNAFKRYLIFNDMNVIYSTILFIINYNMSEVQHQRPVVRYRVELEKRLEINKSYKERRNRANALRILSYGLFGQKRFQNFYLSCSLNCFYWALQIANFLHQRVAGLAMIIKFEQVHVIEYYEETDANGKPYADKTYTKIVIKLAKNPTEDDKKQAGYNAGVNSSDIKDELTEVMGNKRNDGARRRDDRGERGERGERGDNRGRRPFRNNYNRDDRYENNQQRGRNNRDDRREKREDRPERRDGDDKGYRQRRQRDEERDRRPPREAREGQRREDEPAERAPKKQYRGKQRRYGDERDERRISKEETIKQERGIPRTRGTKYSGSYNDRRDEKPQRNEQRPRYEARKEQDRPARQEERGERRPKRSNRYSEDDD